MWSRWLKSLCLGIGVLSASLAMALPSPKDIESTVAAGHYAQAETMLREVLQDKPQSAKAHYELGQVLADEQRYKEAQSELQKAKELDSTLKFASSPEKFHNVYAKVSNLADAPSSSVVMAPSVAPGTRAAAQTSQSVSSSGAGTSLGYVWVVIAGLVALGLWLRRSAAANVSQGAYASPQGYGSQAYAPQGYAPQGYTQPTAGGSTMTGAVVGGLAGVAAGYALSKALESDHHESTPSTAGSSQMVDHGGYIPFDTPASSDIGAFDAGSGSDWDASGSASDDGW